MTPLTVPPVGISAGKANEVPGTDADVEVSGVADLLRHWPDLPRGARFVLMPEEDFDVILAATEGRPLLKIRHYLSFRHIPAKPRKRWWWFS